MLQYFKNITKNNIPT